jgi:pyrroloquinoline quinone (PQQ) biosynthesis protein C
MSKRVDLLASRGDEEADESNSRNTYATMLKPKFREHCDALLDQLVEEFYRSYEPAQKLLNPTFFNHDFFVRSTIESILRIDLMRAVNPLVCTKIAAIDPILCKQWGLYAADEGLHGRMFARDLHAIGITDEVIYSTPPLFSTELLSGYLYHTLEQGEALAVLASAYYVESISDKTQPAWLDNIEKHIGKKSTRGSRAHLSLDEKESHIDLAWNMSMRLVNAPEDEKRFVGHVLKLHSLLSAYVVEVMELTVMQKEAAAAQSTAARQAVLANNVGQTIMEQDKIKSA